MTSDRFLKFVLTLIALELLWLAVYGLPTPASAQVAATPVIITGIRLEAADDILPVTVRGTVATAPEGPVKIEADRPLPVDAVPATPTLRPGL